MTRGGSPGSAAVVVASTRAAAGDYEDRTGPVIVEWLERQGFTDIERAVVADGEPVGSALRAALRRGPSLILTTGGTGLAPTDRTPEQTLPLLDRQVPGLADAVRAAGLPNVPTAVLSRGLAGVAGRTLVVNLPGSLGGVRDGLEVLEPIFSHALQQISGSGDHRVRPDGVGGLQ